ncbi:MAG: spore germination protein GerW family protein [Methanotrichaceae archaeon]
MAADDAAKAAIDELYKSLTIDRIIGAPIEIGDKIILPITRMGIVFGTGLHYGAQDNCAEGRAGGGGGIFPVAVVIIFKSIKGPEGIRVVPLTIPSAQFGLAESLGQIVSSAISRLNVSKTASENKPPNVPHTAEVEIK